MVDFQRTIPGYLNQKENIVKLIIFTAAFALVFINIYAPFGVESWFAVTRLQLFFYSSLVILTGVLVVVISRVFMYHLCKHYSLNLIQFLIWILLEVFFMALFYAVYEKYILHETRLFETLLKVSIQNTALVLLIPYSVLWLYFSWKDKKLMLDQISQGQSFPNNSKNMVPFHDEKGVLQFSVKMESLLYLEASDNYVKVCYLNKEKIARYMLRNTLKKMEANFNGMELIRCHRSYMVNFDKVKVIRKDKDGLMLELDTLNAVDIPVSKTYVENVMKTFSRFSASLGR
ncbi:MAG TPA: LytTR family DNA-binding domain-containing protein [Williamwhitmania sp.]|nr:LytTR family DNA-binding domain-containing protein [Williamwhitmania sp.]